MKKKVLLIGDSIRLGYQPLAIENLGKDYEVWGPEDNARFAKYTLNCLPEWLEKFGKPDIVHWNNGLWDTAMVCPEDGAFTPIDEYLRYISLILRELRKQTTKVIFATTTPVKYGSKNQDIDFIKSHNAAVVEYLQNENVQINDLYSVVDGDIEQNICDDRIHLSETGKVICASAVANAIRSIAEVK